MLIQPLHCHGKFELILLILMARLIVCIVSDGAIPSEFDGTRGSYRSGYIHTSATPKFIKAQKASIFATVNQIITGTGEPYSYTALTGDRLAYYHTDTG